MIKARHECGLAALVFPNEHVAPYLYRMILALQHRGQASAGVATIDENNNVHLHKGIGFVNQVFETRDYEAHKKIIASLKGDIGIAHVRYSTSGKENFDEEAQPFYRRHSKLWKKFVLALNGQLTNYLKIKGNLEKSEYHFDTSTDTEVILCLLSKEIKEKSLLIGDKNPDMYDVVKSLSKELDGSYNLLVLRGDKELAVIRDPLGFRPLCYFYDEKERIFAVASESVALNAVGFEITGHVRPGEIIIYKEGKLEKKIFAESTRRAQCMFERVYFAHDASNLDEGNVYKIRYDLGIELAKRLKDKLKLDALKNYVVIPVPDSGIPAGKAIADYLEINYEPRALVKNREVGRAFIDEKAQRELKMSSKYILNYELIRNKKVIIVDDSRVRGETSTKIINFIAQAKPKEICFAVTCPPIYYPCFYGIDFPTKEELAASKYKELKLDDLEIIVSNEISREISNETSYKMQIKFVYQSLDGFLNAMKLPKSELCLACLNGDYPTPGGFERYLESLS
ncbi:MAG: amidophosphoribosyltransferase [Candidatus Pacearchaeota archaeon]